MPLEVKKGHTVIAPCEEPKNYVKINCEFPQLYGCFPYQEIGIAGEAAKELALGRDTYYYAWDSEDQLNYEGWMYSGICAARLGLTQEAYAFMQKKLASAPKRFPAFWGRALTTHRTITGAYVECEYVDGKLTYQKIKKNQ